MKKGATPETFDLSALATRLVGEAKNRNEVEGKAEPARDAESFRLALSCSKKIGRPARDTVDRQGCGILGL